MLLYLLCYIRKWVELNQKIVKENASSFWDGYVRGYKICHKWSSYEKPMTIWNWDESMLLFMEKLTEVSYRSTLIPTTWKLTSHKNTCRNWWPRRGQEISTTWNVTSYRDTLRKEIARGEIGAKLITTTWHAYGHDVASSKYKCRVLMSL